MNLRMERAMKAVCQVTIFLISTIIFFTIWKIITGMVSHDKSLVIMSLVNGDYSVNFWVFDIFFGMVLPLFLLFLSRGTNYNMILWATGLMMIGIFFMRYDIVIPGQMVSVYHALGVEEGLDIIKYKPSFHEIMATLFGLSLICVAYLAGEKMLNGHQLEKHEIVPEGGYICPGCGAIHFMQEGESEQDAMKRQHNIW
jgi:molybdopterin-containing oxidoreductase family membrane subunit